LTWTVVPPTIRKITDQHTEIVFYSAAGDLHWILTPTLAGSYQYFVNHALPTLGEFRTLWRLDNRTFTHGWTTERDAALVPLKDIRGSNAKKVQDETWQRKDGSFITKYDLATFLPTVEGEPSVWGVYGSLPAGATVDHSMVSTADDAF
jgi:rhamnogalacturonan endolyase